MRRLRHHRRGIKPRLQWTRWSNSIAVAQNDLPSAEKTTNILLHSETALHAATIERVHVTSEFSLTNSDSEVENNRVVMFIAGLILQVPSKTIRDNLGKPSSGLDWVPDPLNQEAATTEPAETDDYPVFCPLFKQATFAAGGNVTEVFRTLPDCGSKSKRRIELGQTFVTMLTIASNQNVDDLLSSSAYIRGVHATSVLYKLN